VLITPQNVRLEYDYYPGNAASIYTFACLMKFRMAFHQTQQKIGQFGWVLKIAKLPHAGFLPY